LTYAKQVGEKVISIALKIFSRIDGLIINHGTLGDVKRISDSTAEEWRSIFDVNFFSAVSLVSENGNRCPKVHANRHDRIALGILNAKNLDVTNCELKD
jgi:NAD(P)-dependent dehydrogenase (short-subunit alcohol dehydrogenase family)